MGQGIFDIEPTGYRTRERPVPDAVTCWNCHRKVTKGVADCPRCVAPFDPEVFIDLQAIPDDPPEIENPPVFAPLGEYREPSRCPYCGKLDPAQGCFVCTGA
jgi:hypothetical protein